MKQCLQTFLDRLHGYRVVGEDATKISYGSAKQVMFEHSCCPGKKHVFLAKPNNFTHGKMCPYCSVPQKKLCDDEDCPICVPKSLFSRKLTFARRFMEYTIPDRVARATFASSHTKIEWRCLLTECDRHTWTATPDNVASGTGCTKCADRVRLTANRKPDKAGDTLERQLEALERRIPSTTFVECIVDGKSMAPKDLARCSNYRATWECGSCSNQWEAIINNVVRLGRSCGKCSANASEQRVEHALDGAALAGLIDGVRPQWRPDGERFRFDFRVRRGPRYVLLEVDGDQHFGPWRHDTPAEGHAERLRRDVEKMKWAARKGMPTVRIPTRMVRFDPFDTDWQVQLMMLVDDAFFTWEQGHHPIIVPAEYASLYSQHGQLL